jgi:hypothetical protein
VDPDPFDIETWWLSNPALGNRISLEFFEEELRLLGPELFAREHLGVWDPVPGTIAAKRVISDYMWRQIEDRRVEPVERRGLGVAVAPDGASAAVVGTGTTADGRLALYVIEHGPGCDWVADEVAGILARQRDIKTVGWDANGPEKIVEVALERVCKEARAKVIKIGTRSYAATCQQLVDHVKAHRLTHRGQESLERAVSTGIKRSYGEDAWLWDTRVLGDITPLKGGTIALRVAEEAKVRRSSSVYEDDDLSIV